MVAAVDNLDLSRLSEAASCINNAISWNDAGKQMNEYEDDDEEYCEEDVDWYPGFFIHSCSDGVKMKETQSPTLICDRAAAGADPVHTGLPPIRGRSENTFHVLHPPQHRTLGPMHRTRAP